MFFVIDKSKILSYVIAICTVVILFMLASGGEKLSNTIQTSTNIVTNQINTTTEQEKNSKVEQVNAISNKVDNILQNTTNSIN